MLQGGINFGTRISTDLQKFSPNANQMYRAAVLHYVDGNQQLQPIIRLAKTHYHQTPEGVSGLGGFLCLSDDTTVANCCKNPTLFGDPANKIAIPIILYPLDFQGNMIPGAVPDLQLLLTWEKGWDKLGMINKTYPLSSNDFTITGKKAGRGVALDFMPAGPAHWQQDPDMFRTFLQKAKVLIEGPALNSIDRMVGRKVTIQDVDNALRAASGLPPSLPPPPAMPMIPPMPGGGMMMPNMSALPPAAAAPAPIPTVASAMAPPPAVVPPPAAAQVAVPPPQTGPASVDQMAALASILAPPPASEPEGDMA